MKLTLVDNRLRLITLCFVAALFGALCVLPAIAFRFDSDVRFRGIEMEATDAEYHYAARVNEVMDGFWKTANVFYAGDKQQPYLQPPLPEIVVAALGRLTGQDAARAVVLSEALLGALIVIVMVGCFHALTRRFWWSLIGVAVFLFAGPHLSDPFMSWKLLQPTGWQYVEFLPFARAINPQWSASLFFGALWAFIVWIRRPSPRALVVVGALTTLSFYSYIYSWTLLGTLYVIVGAWYLARREYARVRALLLLAAGLVVSFVPYGINLWQAMHHPFYAETSMRFGLVLSRQPQIGITLLIPLIIAFVFRKQLGQMAWLVGGFGLAAIITQNQQLITGKSIVLSHYHWYFVKPVASILMITLIGSWLWDVLKSHLAYRRLYAGLSVVVMLGALLFGGLYQTRSHQSARPFWSEQQRTAGALAYLKEHGHPGDAVYAQGFIRDLIPVYTSADVYWATNASGYLSSDRRARDAYFFDLWLKGVSADEAATTFFTTRRAELSSRIHSIYYREAVHDYAGLPDAEVSAHVAAYRAFMDAPVHIKTSTYPLDQIVVSKDDEMTQALRSLLEQGTRVYDDGEFAVWNVRKS